jgi:hypothetical protein
MGNVCSKIGQYAGENGVDWNENDRRLREEKQSKGEEKRNFFPKRKREKEEKRRDGGRDFFSVCPGSRQGGSCR